MTNPPPHKHTTDLSSTQTPDIDTVLRDCVAIQRDRMLGYPPDQLHTDPRHILTAALQILVTRGADLDTLVAPADQDKLPIDFDTITSTTSDADSDSSVPSTLRDTAPVPATVDDGTTRATDGYTVIVDFETVAQPDVILTAVDQLAIHTAEIGPDQYQIGLGVFASSPDEASGKAVQFVRSLLSILDANHPRWIDTTVFENSH